MKTRNIFLLALTALFTVSCHSWDAPGDNAGMESFGNKYLEEANVVTVASLKESYKTVISKGDFKQITKPTMIKVIVTGNDEGSNIYKKLYVCDETGGIYISINKSGIYTEAGVGQCMLIDLNGLYIGGYGQQPQIGTTYEQEGVTKMGRMNRFEWNDHFKLIPPVEGLSVKPISTNDIGAFDLDKDFGKVIKLVGITAVDADGTNTFAPIGSSGETNRQLANQSSTVYLRTSSYAKFAGKVIPQGKFNVTGIASRFGSDWQIYIRTLSDIEDYKGDEVLDIKVDVTPINPEGDGSAANPFNVAAAIAKCKEIGGTASSQKYYVKGFVAADAQASEQYGNITFEMKATKTGGESFTAYQMAGSDGKKLPSSFTVSKGDEVIIYGALLNYGGNKPETDGQGKSIIVSVNGKKTDGTDADSGDTPTPSQESNVTTSLEGTVLTLINTTVTASTNTVSVDLNEQGWQDTKEPTTVTLSDGTTIVFGKGEGGSTPKFYAATKGVRLYAKNTIAITGSSKAIAKVVLNCDSYNGTDYVGNSTLYGSANDKTLTVVNEHTGTSGGVQLRVKTIDVTYAE